MCWKAARSHDLFGMKLAYQSSLHALGDESLPTHFQQDKNQQGKRFDGLSMAAGGDDFKRNDASKLVGGATWFSMANKHARSTSPSGVKGDLTHLTLLWAGIGSHNSQPRLPLRT